MSLFNSLYDQFNQYLIKTFELQLDSIKNCIIDENCEEKRSDFGDFSSNAPLVIAKVLKKNPREIALRIVQDFVHDNVIKIEIAGAGFLNFFVKNCLYDNFIDCILKNPELLVSKKFEKISYNVEFVSANPTGPLHVGHGRGGIIGDLFSRILKAKGYITTSEFYINDAGAQIDKLGLSLLIRYKALCNIHEEFPDDGYHGEYLIEMAHELYNRYDNLLLDNDIVWFSSYAKEKLLNNINRTLLHYGITFDVWFSEKTLHENGSIEHALAMLEKNGFTYISEDGSLWLRSTLLGDDKDRVIRRTNGIYTYVAADIAYLQNKIDRGAQKIIMVLGQDHHSYVVRLKAALHALGHNPDILDIILYQLVTVKDAGELVRLSKRAGKIISLEDVIETVGSDIARFFYLNKKADAHLDFDIQAAMQKNDTNPVYYIQYSFVRIKSILKKADTQKIIFNQSSSSYEYNIIERMIIRKINHYDQLLDNIIRNYQVHLVSHYAYEISSLFNTYYNQYICIDLEDKETTVNRLRLLSALYNLINQFCDILGMTKPDMM